MLSAITLGFRGVQLILSAVVVGLAATLIKGQVIGDSPVTTRYSTFTGGFGIIVAFLGAAALFISAIPDIVILGIDAVCGLLFAAGGIAWAVGLKGISCTDEKDSLDMLKNGLLNQGSAKTKSGTAYGVYKDTDSDEKAWSRLQSNCKRGMGDEISQFLLFGIAVGLLALGWIRWKKGGKSGGGGYIA